MGNGTYEISRCEVCDYVCRGEGGLEAHKNANHRNGPNSQPGGDEFLSKTQIVRIKKRWGFFQ